MLCLSSNIGFYCRSTIKRYWDCHFWKSAQGYNHLFRIAQASKRGRQDCQTHAMWLEYDGEMKNKLKTQNFLFYDLWIQRSSRVQLLVHVSPTRAQQCLQSLAPGKHSLVERSLGHSWIQTGVTVSDGVAYGCCSKWFSLIHPWGLKYILNYHDKSEVHEIYGYFWATDGYCIYMGAPATNVCIYAAWHGQVLDRAALHTDASGRLCATNLALPTTKSPLGLRLTKGVNRKPLKVIGLEKR
jgi:hypothetical protein